MISSWDNLAVYPTVNGSIIRRKSFNLSRETEKNILIKDLKVIFFVTLIRKSRICPFMSFSELLNDLSWINRTFFIRVPCLHQNYNRLQHSDNPSIIKIKLYTENPA